MIEGDDAAVAYPGLSLVEHGRWGESARRILDAYLPWLPHRSNEELARLFAVEQIAADDRNLRLKFTLPIGAKPSLPNINNGKPKEDSESESKPFESYIEAAFSRKTGLPVSWEVFVDDNKSYRLRFSEPEGKDPHVHCKSVVIEDEAGNEGEK